MSNIQNAAAIAEQEQTIPSFALERTMWNDAQLMSTSCRAAEMLAKTTVIPQQYRGKSGDCLIAIDMANRMAISPIMVMQASQVVQGNFTWKGTACRALIDGCGKFRNSHYVMVGKEGTPTWGCKLVAIRSKTGESVSGPAVTMQMALDEGWVNKNGSKWKTMPELMLRYRAASFFAKTECPEVLMGFQTAEEMQDIVDIQSDFTGQPEEEAAAVQESPEAPAPAEGQVSLRDV